MAQKTAAADGQPTGARAEGVSALTLVAFVVVTVLLGMNFVSVRFSNQELPPFWGATLRFAVAGLLLLVVVRLRGLPLPRGGALTAAVIFGVLLFGAMYALAYWALLTVASAMVAVVFATMPLLTLMLASLTGLERLSVRGVLGAVVAVGGLAVIFREQLQADVPLAGLAAAFLAVILASVSTVAVKRFPRSHPVSTNAVAMTVGAVILLVTSLMARETWVLPTLASTWTALVYLIFSAIVAFVLMIWILGRWNASATNYSSVLQPLVTVAGASLLAGEQISLLFLGGALLVLAGVYVGAAGGVKQSPEPLVAACK